MNICTQSENWTEKEIQCRHSLSVSMDTPDGKCINTNKNVCWCPAMS